MFKKLHSRLKTTFIRYMLSYVLLMAVLLCAITAYMYVHYSKSVYDNTESQEVARTSLLRYRADGYLAELAHREAKDALYVNTAGELADGFEFEDYTDAELAGRIIRAERMTLLPAQAVEGAWEDTVTLICPGEEGALVCLVRADELLSERDSDSESGCNRYIISGDSIICGAGDVKLDENTVLRAGAYVNDTSTEIKRLNGREYLFIAVPGSYEGIVYVSVLPLTGIRVRAAGIWLGFTAVLLLLAAPCVAFMLYISRKNLTPLLEMGRRFGSDDVNGINEGINELESRNRVLETDSLAARKRLFARELVGGLYPTRDEAEKAASEAGVDMAHPYYAVILVGADGSGKDSRLSDEIPALGENRVFCAVSAVKEKAQTLAVCFSDSRDSLFAFAEKLTGHELIKAMRLPVAVSAAHEDISEISTALLEATGAYESRFIMGDTRLLSFERIPFTGGSNPPGTEDHASEIKQALAEGDMGKVNACLERLRQSLRGEEMNLFRFRRVYNEIIEAIMSENGGAACAEYDLFSLSGCRSAEELESILAGVCESVIAARGEKRALPLIQEILRIMTENYTDREFTLTRAAEMAGITPARLSGEFKTGMGMTPVDYLTMLRMEEAKKLLKQTDLPVGDVCGLSGYSDASSFTRRFKQYAGETPLAFRAAARGNTNK